MDSENSAPSEYYFRQWAEYYRLRKWARASAISFPPALFGLMLLSEPLLARMEGLPTHVTITIVMISIGAGTILFSAPLLKWIDWKCPRCGHKFAYPMAHFGIWTLLTVFWRLAFDSRCSTCRLECGAHEITFPK
jgi:hypothetical protein